MDDLRLQDANAPTPWLVNRERIPTVLPSQLPVVLFVELEIPRLAVCVAVHRRLDFDRRSVPHPITPTGSLEIDAVFLGELLLDERAVPIGSVRSAH